MSQNNPKSPRVEKEKTAAAKNDRRRGHRRGVSKAAASRNERRIESRRRTLKERRATRIEKSLPVRLKIGDPTFKGKELTAISRNVGESGIFIETDVQEAEIIPLLQSRRYTIEVEVHVPDRDVKIKTAAEVVRVNSDRNLSGGRFGIGLKFVEISEDRKAELTAYLNDLVKTDQDIIDVNSLGSLERERFTFNKTLYLTDTNALGNAYFARYFDWQGMAREEFLRALIPDPLGFFKTGMKILTLEAQMEYKHELTLYDEIEIEVRTANMRRVSLDLIFIFRKKNTGQTIAQGRQKLAFADHVGRFAPIPPLMRNNALKYLTEALRGSNKLLPNSEFVEEKKT